MAVATLTSKGQITIPKAVREHLHISTGDRLDFEIDNDGKVRIAPIGASVRELFGMGRRPGQDPVTVEEMRESVIELLSEKDAAISQGS